MSIELQNRLAKLAADCNARLDRIHDEAIAKFRTLARSVGQRTRVKK